MVDNNLVNATRDAHFAQVRCATRAPGCLPIDSLLSVDSLCIGQFTTMNLERKGQRAQGIRRQVNGPLNIHVTSETEENNNLVCNISIHQDQRYLNTSRSVGKYTTHPEYYLSERNMIYPESDLSEDNTVQRELSLRIRHPLPPHPTPPHPPSSPWAVLFGRSAFLGPI